MMYTTHLFLYTANTGYKKANTTHSLNANWILCQSATSTEGEKIVNAYKPEVIPHVNASVNTHINMKTPSRCQLVFCKN